jgi:ABC-2 type transport system permease protein
MCDAGGSRAHCAPGRSVPAPDAWPMQHPELAVLIWSVGLIAIFAPTGVYLYRRKVLR